MGKNHKANKKDKDSADFADIVLEICKKREKTNQNASKANENTSNFADICLDVLRENEKKTAESFDNIDNNSEKPKIREKGKNSENFVTAVLKWAERQDKSRTETEEFKKESQELADKIIKWYERDKDKKDSNKEGNPMMFKDVHGLRHYKEETGSVVELGRIEYKGSAAKLYLPKRVCNALKLDREKDSTLVIVAADHNSLFLIKDSAVAEMLKPQILEKRKLDLLLST